MNSTTSPGQRFGRLIALAGRRINVDLELINPLLDRDDDRDPNALYSLCRYTSMVILAALTPQPNPLAMWFRVEGLRPLDALRAFPLGGVADFHTKENQCQPQNTIGLMIRNPWKVPLRNKHNCYARATATTWDNVSCMGVPVSVPDKPL